MAQAALIPLLVVGALAGAGVSAASAAGAFTSDPDSPDPEADPRAEDERRRALIANRNQVGRSSLILAGGRTQDPLETTKPKLLGGVAIGPQPGSPTSG